MMSVDNLPSSREDIVLPISSVDPQWLLNNLRDAARNSGCESWWLMEDVAMAIWAYLHCEDPRPVVSLAKFEKSIRSVLHEIGYAEVAASFRLAHPLQQFSLLECIHNPPLRSEADFFVRLRSEIRRFHYLGVRHLCITDLSACEIGLPLANSMFPWCASPLNRLKTVAFVRRQLKSMCWPHRVRCSIS